MKKALIFIVTLGFVLTLSACTSADLDRLNDILNTEALSSKESLATLSYLSGSLLDVKTEDPVVNSGLIKLSAVLDTDETELEGELDVVNEYMDRLKELMDNGTDAFGNAVEEVSDNPDYAFMITFTVNEEDYIIYYNIDILTLEISGIMLIGDVEYVIEVSNTLSDNDALDNDDDDDEIDDEEQDTDGEEPDDDDDDDDSEEGNQEEDLDDEETEQKMVLMAYNGDDFVKVIYKVETDDEETETKFTLESNIAGVTREVFMKISIEEDEYKITIEEDENEYTFKREVEDEETTYKLKYKVNGVEGEVKIIETVNDLGEIVYEYKISEGGKSSTVERDEPNHHSDDDDDDDDEEENESEEENEEENEEADEEVDGI